jgi:flagellar biosynthesis anti-sigma factor FlgM
MKIGLNVNRVLSIYNNNSKTDSIKNVKKPENDQINISSAGRELSKFVELAKNTELTDTKVDEIKKLISDKKYEVNSEALAKSILEHIKGSEK